MVNIEIPKVETISGVGEDESQISLVLHFLLTSLFRHKRALLHAEYRRPQAETAWYLRQRTADSEGNDVVLAVRPSPVMQSCVARLALAIDQSHFDGGYGRIVMTQEGQKCECRIFYSNSSDSGSWIRIYSQTI